MKAYQKMMEAQLATQRAAIGADDKKEEKKKE
jgi:hypothetical protein